MTTNQPTPVILSDADILELEIRPYDEVYARPFNKRMVRLTVEERDALCATVRALRTENELAEKVFKFILPNRPLATLSELAKPVLDEVDALREQLAGITTAIEQRAGKYCDRPEDMPLAAVINAGFNVLESRLAQYEECVTCACGRPSWHRKGDEPL